MNALQRDGRGYPIPFVVIRDTDGCPHFTANDHRKRWQSAKENRCGICGTRIKGELLWFVGGPMSAFHPDGVYRDTAMHHECMTYAMQVCPYLALRSYKGRIDDKTIDYDKLETNLMFFDPTMIPERPVLFVAVGSNKQILLDRPDMSAEERVHANVRPERPYKAIEYWQDGVKLDDAAALPLVAQALGVRR